MPSLWKHLPLRSRLFVSFGVLLAVILAFSLILQSSFHTSSRVTSLIEEELPSRLEHLGSEVALRLSPSLEMSRNLASNTYIERWVRDGMPEEGLDDVKKEMARVNDLLDAGIVFIAGNDGDTAYYHHYQKGQLNRRVMERDSNDDAWYFRFLKSNAPYELNLDSNEFSGEQLQMFVNYRSLQQNPQGEPVSVAGVGIDMLHLAEMISAYRLGETGRASLVSADGQVQVAPEATLVRDFSASAELSSLLNRDKIQVLETRHDGEELFVGSIWVEDLQRFLMVEVPRSEFMGAINQQLYTSLLIGAVLILLSLLVLYPLSGSLTRPLKAFQEQLQQITHSLDLSQRIQVPDDAELGKLAQQTNGLLEKIHNVITAVSSSSTQLNDSANRLAYTAGLVSRNSDLQDEVSQSMAAAVEEMSSSVAEITSTMEELSTSSTQIADHSQSVVDVANLTLDNSRKGVDAMQHLQERMGDIYSDSQQSLAEIMELGAKSKQISRVMDLINDLADQTKLIAFNAALEASSAGESGKRFSVVASEIRRLADSVTDSTREIEDRIQEIQDSISRLVITSEKGSNSIQAGMEVSSSTAEDLNALLEAASQTSSAAEQISLSTKQQKTASSQVVVALRDIASASSHNAQSVRSITDISEDMVAMSDQLNELVKAFK
ncbi:methyl-accepting chemotaxis protein [Marinospirillum sp.]|uniref:methyl-accepting chemotaxis protein n=1 Tax=Marinospirillum sp. TaxID=2183934 RepID=UPI00384BE3C4